MQFLYPVVVDPLGSFVKLIELLNTLDKSTGLRLKQVDNYCQDEEWSSIVEMISKGGLLILKNMNE